MLALSGLENFKHLEPNDFVISLRSFEGGIERSKYRGCVSPAYTVLRCTRQFSPDYWAYILKATAYVSALQTMTQGIRDGKNISYEQFGAIFLPLPNEEEQTQIASFLDRETSKIDTLIAEQERLLTLLTEKRQATISRAVTKGLNPDVPMKDSGVEWLGEVPEHWNLLRIKVISQFTTSGPRGWSERLADNGSLFIQSGDLNDSLGLDFETANRVSVSDDAEANRTRLAEGDVVVCITGAKTGNVAMCTSLGEPAYINQHLCLIRPTNAVISRFLAIALKSDVGQTQFALAQYGLKQGLSLENVRELWVPFPPRKEQKEIVDFLEGEVSKNTLLATAAQQGICLLQERRSALIAAAVTGQIDVRET